MCSRQVKYHLNNVSRSVRPVLENPRLSIIVPFYNEEESIRPLYAAIVAAVSPLQVTFEMIFVDDGSADGTVRIATELARSDSRVRVVKFRRNYGQTPAMAAGIEHADRKSTRL